MPSALTLLLGLTLVRLAVAAGTPLIPDETYYWVWSRSLQPGYLDHPPMVAVWIRLGTALAGETALGVRLLAPVSAMLGSLAVADAAERLFPGRRAGVPAAALLNATLMVGAGAVTMTPDTPLLFFATLALWAMTRAIEDPRWWLGFGAAIGGAGLSKYTALLPALAAPLFLLWMGRLAVLRSPYIWVGAGLALLLFVPVALWNETHQWASFAKQGGRTGDWRPALGPRFEAELLAGQLGLATPVVFVLFAAGLWATLVRAWRREPGDAVLTAFTLPGLLVFVEHALGDRVQGNWPALLYPPLAIAAAALAWRRWRWAAGTGFAITGLAYLQAVAGPVPLPRALDPTLVRLAGWSALAAEADQVRHAQGLGFIAAEDYGLAGELAWHAPAGTEIVGAEPRWRLFELPHAAPGAGLLLLSERRREAPDPALWTDVTRLADLSRARGGVEAERFRVYRATLRAAAPAAIMPSRLDRR